MEQTHHTVRRSQVLNNFTKCASLRPSQSKGQSFLSLGVKAGEEVLALLCPPCAVMTAGLRQNKLMGKQLVQSQNPPLRRVSRQRSKSGLSVARPMQATQRRKATRKPAQDLSRPQVFVTTFRLQMRSPFAIGSFRRSLRVFLRQEQQSLGN